MNYEYNKLLSDGVVMVVMVAANIVTRWSYSKLQKSVSKYLLAVV
jgi:hypothetical protein